MDSGLEQEVLMKKEWKPQKTIQQSALIKCSIMLPLQPTTDPSSFPEKMGNHLTCLSENIYSY